MKLGNVNDDEVIWLKLVHDCANGVCRLEEINTFLDGGSTDVARGLDSGVRAVSAAAVTTLEDHRAHVLLTQRTVDSI